MASLGHNEFTKLRRSLRSHRSVIQLISMAQSCQFNSLAPGRFERNFIQANWSWFSWLMAGVSLVKLPLDKSTLVQVMAWCRQATSHYLSQCWPRSVLPYGVTRPQWVKVCWYNWQVTWQPVQCQRPLFLQCQKPVFHDMDKNTEYRIQNLYCFLEIHCHVIKGTTTIKYYHTNTTTLLRDILAYQYIIHDC